MFVCIKRSIQIEMITTVISVKNTDMSFDQTVFFQMHFQLNIKWALSRDRTALTQHPVKLNLSDNETRPQPDVTGTNLELLLTFDLSALHIIG